MNSMIAHQRCSKIEFLVGDEAASFLGNALLWL